MPPLAHAQGSHLLVLFACSSLVYHCHRDGPSESSLVESNLDHTASSHRKDFNSISTIASDLHEGSSRADSRSGHATAESNRVHIASSHRKDFDSNSTTASDLHEASSRADSKSGHATAESNFDHTASSHRKDFNSISTIASDLHERSSRRSGHTPAAAKDHRDTSKSGRTTGSEKSEQNYPWLAEPLNFTVLLNIDSAKSKVYNAAFIPCDAKNIVNGMGHSNSTTRQVAGHFLGRWLFDPNHHSRCGAKPPYLPSGQALAYAEYHPGMIDLSWTPLPVPENLKCKNVEEPKWSLLRGEKYVYAAGDWDCPSSIYDGLTPATRKTYQDTGYKSYFFKFGERRARRLVTKERIEKDQPTAKNFLLFEYEKETLALVLIRPHKIYRLDLATGLMEPAYETNQNLLPQCELGLNAGPLRLETGNFLVASHIRSGGWHGMRLPFFYIFHSRPPFEILAATMPFSFGLSNWLEYITGMHQDNDDLIISIGYDDCQTSLVRIPMAAILLKLLPINQTNSETPKDLCDASLSPMLVGDQSAFVNSSILMAVQKHGELQTLP